ncbi:DUF896 domain-containing protein [Beduini massiliensis]|uniref:DUF896 domain-containing protein n=1 Tax=Beduini massiliensis TaxID=1585974 RepID=UPI00059A83A7|nr:DUF896 domain-containing protein [Beduini massiliensis]
MEMDELIARINFLAKKKKTEGLTEEEKTEQQALYQEYLKIFRAGFKQQLTSVKVVDAQGNDITPEKIKEEKMKNSGMTH